MLGQENREIEKLLIDAGAENKVSLLYNTNATIFSESVVRAWKKFKRVQICLSIDDIGERLEFQRFPAKWSRVEANIRKYLEHQDERIQLTLFCSVSVLNIFYLPDYIAWQQANFPGIDIYFNFVHDPKFFCINNMPEGMRVTAAANLRELLPAVKNQLTTFQVNEVINFLSRAGAGDPLEIRTTLFKELAYRDKIRQQNWREILPRLVDAYEELLISI